MYTIIYGLCQRCTSILYTIQYYEAAQAYYERCSVKLWLIGRLIIRAGGRVTFGLLQNFAHGMSATKSRSSSLMSKIF